MQHADPDQLALMALGEPADDRDLTAHLDRCAQCRAEVESLRRTVKLVRETVADRDEVRPPQSVWQRIAADLTLPTDPRTAARGPEPVDRPARSEADPPRSAAPAPRAHDGDPPSTTDGGADADSRDRPRHGSAAVSGRYGVDLPEAADQESGADSVGRAGHGSADAFGRHSAERLRAVRPESEMDSVGRVGSGSTESLSRRGVGSAAGDRVAGEGPAVRVGRRTGGMAAERARRRRRVLTGVGALVAAAAVGVVGTLVAVRPWEDGSSAPRTASASLEPVTGGPGGVSGRAVVVQGRSGPELDVDTTGLPTGAGYYEVWVFDGRSDMVSVGVLGGDTRATLRLPSTLDLRRFRVIDISEEQYDGNQTHSTVSVLRGTLTD